MVWYMVWYERSVEWYHTRSDICNKSKGSSTGWRTYHGPLANTYTWYKLVEVISYHTMSCGNGNGTILRCGCVQDRQNIATMNNHDSLFIQHHAHMINDGTSLRDAQSYQQQSSARVRVSIVGPIPMNNIDDAFMHALPCPVCIINTFNSVRSRIRNDNWFNIISSLATRSPTYYIIHNTWVNKLIDNARKATNQHQVIRQ